MNNDETYALTDPVGFARLINGDGRDADTSVCDFRRNVRDKMRTRFRLTPDGHLTLD